MPFDNIANSVREGARIGDKPVPLLHTDIRVTIRSGLSTVTTERKFRNSGTTPMEATLTFPVPPRAVVHGLEATIDGRVLHGKVEARAKARETYETGMDTGKTSILHEQVASGIHMLSLGQVRPEAEISVRVIWTMPLTAGRNNTATMLIPTTIGDIYGHAPMQDSDAPVYADHIHPATLFVDADCNVQLEGKSVSTEGMSVQLNAPIVLRTADVKNTVLTGRSQDGKSVTMEFTSSPQGTMNIEGHILMDRSGSMGGQAHARTPGVTKHNSAVSGLRLAFEEIREGDSIGLWEFDHAPNHVASVTGPESFRKNLEKFRENGGSTEIGAAVAYVLNNTREGDILVLTDGQTYHVDIGNAPLNKRRIHAVYIGEETLQGGLEELVRKTGGESREAADRCDDAVISALGALRRGKLPAVKMSTSGNPLRVYGNAGDNQIKVTWKKAKSSETSDDLLSDAVAAYAAHMAIPHVADASAWAALNSIVTDSTSLVLVDSAGEKIEGLSVTQKVALSRPRTMGAPGAMRGMAINASGAPGSALIAMSASGGSSMSFMESMSRTSGSSLYASSLSSPTASVSRTTRGMMKSPVPSQGGGLLHNKKPYMSGKTTPAFPALPDTAFVPKVQVITGTTEELGRLIDWDTEGARIIAEGWMIISIHARAVLATMITDAVRRDAVAAGVSPELFLLARAAATVQGNRSAARFARKIFPSAA